MRQHALTGFLFGRKVTDPQRIALAGTVEDEVVILQGIGGFHTDMMRASILL
jgi:hypothetical protein